MDSFDLSKNDLFKNAFLLYVIIMHDMIYIYVSEGGVFVEEVVLVDQDHVREIARKETKIEKRTEGK